MKDHVCGCASSGNPDSGGINVSEKERYASTIVGGFLLALVLSPLGLWWRVAAVLLGAALIYRGLSGNCLFYRSLGRLTRREAKHADEQIDEAGEESFPASDPPAFNAAAASPSRRRPSVHT